MGPITESKKFESYILVYKSTYGRNFGLQKLRKKFFFSDCNFLGAKIVFNAEFSVERTITAYREEIF